MSPETFPHQLEQDFRLESLPDITRPEQVAYLLPDNEARTDESDRPHVYIALNPSIGTHEEVTDLLDRLDHDLKKDLRGIDIDTEKAFTTLMFADENGVIEDTTGPLASKIEQMEEGERAGKIPSLPAIRVTAEREVIDNPLFANFTAALIGKHLESSGTDGEAWLENLIGTPDPVCIQTGEYALIDALRQEYNIRNVDQCVREEAVFLLGDPAVDITPEQVINPETSAEQEIKNHDPARGEKSKGLLGKFATRSHFRLPRIAH